MYRLSRSIPRIPARHYTMAQYSQLASKMAEEVSSKWQGTTANGGKTKNYIGGEFRESSTDRWIDVLDPVGETAMSVADATSHPKPW